MLIQGPNPGYLEYGVFLQNGAINPRKNRVILLTGISMDWIKKCLVSLKCYNGD